MKLSTFICKGNRNGSCKNPRGVVPVIEINGEIIYESDITSEYADAAFEGRRKVVEQDPLIRAKGKVLLGDLTSAMGESPRYGTDKRPMMSLSKGLWKKLPLLFKLLQSTSTPTSLISLEVTKSD